MNLVDIGLVIVPLLSFGAAFFWGRLSLWIGLLCAVVFPCLATWPMYWLPVTFMNVRDTSEYSLWYPVFALLWLVCALPVSVVATVLVWVWRKKIRRRKNEAA